jgi:hypothetical protein
MEISSAKVVISLLIFERPHRIRGDQDRPRRSHELNVEQKTIMGLATASVDTGNFCMPAFRLKFERSKPHPKQEEEHINGRPLWGITPFS